MIEAAEPKTSTRKRGAPKAKLPRKRTRTPRRTMPNITNDPIRALIATHARQRGISQRRLSELCGREHGWMSVYLHKGVPRLLDIPSRAIIAKTLELDEARLCAPGQAPLTPPTPDRIVQPGVVTSDIPLFQEGDLIDPNDAQEWAPRPSDYPGAGGLFALQLRKGGGRTRPGDMIYVATRPPRIGDLAVCLRGTKVAAIGELAHMDERVIRLDTGVTMRTLPAAGHQVCKVTSLVTA